MPVRAEEGEPAWGGVPVRAEEGEPAWGEVPVRAEEGEPAWGEVPVRAEEGEPAWEYFNAPALKGSPSSLRGGVMTGADAKISLIRLIRRQEKSGFSRTGWVAAAAGRCGDDMG